MSSPDHRVVRPSAADTPPQGGQLTNNGARVVPGRLPAAGRDARARGGPPWMGAAMPAEKAMTFGPSAKRLLRMLRPERRPLVLVLTLAVVSVALTVIGPKLLGHATDVIFRGVLGTRLPSGLTLEQVAQRARADGDNMFADLLLRTRPVPGVGIDFGALAQVLLIAAALYLVAFVFGVLQGYVLNAVVQSTIRRLRADVEAKMHRVPLDYVDGQPRGELLSRVTNDIDNIAQSLQQTLGQLLTSLLTVLGVITMMFVISPLLAVLALITVPLSIMMTKAIGKRSQGRFIAQWRATGQLNALIEETYSGHELVRVYGQRTQVEASFARTNDELYRASFGAQSISGTILPSMMFLGNLNYVLIAVVGGLRVANGSMTLGDVQAFIQYSRQFGQPLSQIASMANLLQSGVASAERVFDLLDAPEQSPDPADAPASLARRGRVAFEHVSFSYRTPERVRPAEPDADGSLPRSRPDEPLIDDLSLVAEPGRTVAIVGPTGAGKTTLVNLIMRFYELDSGRITLDDVDITALRRAQLRGSIGMVLQDTWLFGGTIWDNIAYGRPDATDDEIRYAAEVAFVHRFVQALPDGYDTVLDEQSSNISAGQRQLITIARAFLADPTVLILDEATSSVDTRTELLVQHATAALRADRTSFVIAHRLSTIRDADLILVMEHGRIVEQGTHADLLSREGAYFDLYSAQFAAPVEEPVG